MRKLVVGIAVVSGVALAASQAMAQGGYQPPQCELSTGHFLVNSGVTYIKSASEEEDQEKRERLMNDARRNLIDAMERGQQDNPAAWYYLGRYYVMANDAVGADSAFDRAEQMAPDCHDDIVSYRQRLWVPTINQAIETMRVGAFDEAKDVLLRAWAIYQDDNITPYYLARIYGSDGVLDSSLYFFKATVAIGDADSSRQQNYQDAMFNVGVVSAMQEEWDSAAVWYQRYLTEVNPDDSQALTGLARALAKSGKDDRALALYDSVLARAPRMDALDLFRAGEALFVAEQYHKAAKAFSLGLEKHPQFRPGLYNLANTYLAICNDDNEPQAARDTAARAMEKAGKELVAIDPQSSEALRLLAAAYQIQRKDDSTLAVLERIEALTFDVYLDVLQTDEGGYTIEGRITNPGDADVSMPPLNFEFLDAQRNVVTTGVLEGRTLPAGASEPFTLQATGDAIVAARYKVGG
jgi:tetratricopeptide (TPR) repeat protein